MPPWLTVLHNPIRPDYLPGTLAELDHAGAASLANFGRLHRLIAVDGDPTDVDAPPGWTLFSVGDGGQGIRRALLSTVQAAANAGAEHLLYFEDDVIASCNAVLALNTIPVHPRCGFLVACDVRRGLTTKRQFPHMAVIPGDGELFRGGFWGTQAVKIPGRALQHLQGKEIASDDRRFHEGDVWLGEQLASVKAPWPSIAVLSPSIFQHVGEKSIAHPHKTFKNSVRQAADFSATFDALEISDVYAARAQF